VQPPPRSAVQSVAPDAAEAILGQRVTDAEGKDIGRLVDVLVDGNGQPQAAGIDFGGFMGVGNRKIAVHWSALHFSPGDLKHKVALDMPPNQIKAAPEFLKPNKAACGVTPAEPAPRLPRPRDAAFCICSARCPPSARSGQFLCGGCADGVWSVRRGLPDDA